jgi:GNAT superfamily N-acetyltransferase
VGAQPVRHGLQGAGERSPVSSHTLGVRRPTRSPVARDALRIRRATGSPATRHPLRIRRATRRDAATILDLVRGLAEYEHLTHEVEATLARIRRHGFGRARYFEALICRRGRVAVGFALYFFTYSTFLGRPTLYLEDLFVIPAERGHGAGRALLVALAKVALRRGCGRLEWAVLDWNAPAIRFYEKLGARLRRDWILTRLAGAPLRRLAAGRS